MTRAPAHGRPHYTLVLVLLALGGTSFALLQSLVFPALPEIQRSLHSSESGVAWIITANLLSGSILTPFIGRLGDMFGKKRVLVATLAVLAAGTLVSALASTLGVMILGRVVQGAGAGIFPLAFGIIRDEFPRDRIAGGLGLMSSLLGIGGGLGLVLPGPIVDNLSYHWLFWLPLVIVVLTIGLTALFVPESPMRVRESINWIALGLMSAGLSMVLIAVNQAPSWGWGSVRTLALIVAGLLVLGGWVAVEARARQPLVDMTLMRVRGVWTANLAALLLGVAMYASFVVIPQFVETSADAGYGFGASVTQAGLFMLPAAVIQLFVGPMTGRIERAIGSRLQLAIGLAFVGGSFIVLLISRQRESVYAASALLGIGFAFALSALPNLIVSSVDQRRTGVATGVNNLMRSLGGALGGQLAATFIVSYQSRDGVPLEHGYGLAFAMCAAAPLLGIAVCAAIPSRRRGAGAGSAPEPAPAAVRPPGAGGPWAEDAHARPAGS